MARGNFRTSDRICLFCGFRGTNNEIVMPYKFGEGANKTYLCEKCGKRAMDNGIKVVKN